MAINTPANKNEIKVAGAKWPVSFEDVEHDHLGQMLKMTPAQRFALANELLEFAVMAGVVKEKDSVHI